MEKKKKAIVFGFFAFLIPIASQAATLYFSPSSGTFSVGNTFSVSVFVSSQDQAMNAASGQILFPTDKLEVLSISKTGSIFNLWIREPSFSNELGTVEFEGIVLNPGFTGAAGKIITINFRAKTAGIANLSFSSGAVLANDSKGTNILKSLESASFSLVAISETPTQGIPAAPQISSPTHPDQNKWYPISNAKFTWPLPSDVTAVRILVGKIPEAIPTVQYEPPISEKEISNLEDGIWYFHLQFKNKFGWGEISHFRFQIDTQPPKPFKIEVKEGKEITNPSPTLVFGTTDEMSGIDHYQIIIDGKEPIITDKSEYKIPPQDLGKHIIIVKAVDKAGNETLAMTEIEILPIEAPVITDYPKELLPGSILSIKGRAIPEAKIIVFIQKDKEKVKTGETQSDKEGKFSYIEVEPVEKGVYQVWAQAQDPSGAKSNFSEKVTILVNPPVFIKIGKLAIDYLTTIVTLLILILIIVLMMVWIWQKIKQRKKRLKKEVSEAEKALYQAFKALKEEVEEQVAKLDGKPDLNEREKEICDKLKEALKIAHEFVEKEIKDIEREIK